MIPIPEEYRAKLLDDSEIDVEIRARNKNGDEPYDIISELMSHPIKITDFTPFSREEIYDRRL